MPSWLAGYACRVGRVRLQGWQGTPTGLAGYAYRVGRVRLQGWQGTPAGLAGYACRVGRVRLQGWQGRAARGGVLRAPRADVFVARLTGWRCLRAGVRGSCTQRDWPCARPPEPPTPAVRCFARLNRPAACAPQAHARRMGHTLSRRRSHEDPSRAKARQTHPHLKVGGGDRGAGAIRAAYKSRACLYGGSANQSGALQKHLRERAPENRSTPPAFREVSKRNSN